jgi:arylsulfatase
MDAEEAGRIATSAGVGRLLLAHVPAEVGREPVLTRAGEHFDGPIDLAEPGLRIEVVTTTA